MTLGDILILEQSNLAGRGARRYNVAAGATVINPGEPVTTIGAQGITVSAMLSNSPIIGSDYFVGIAATTSTQTSSTAGIVTVYPNTSLTTYLIKPKVPTSWDTQAEYDALVGKNVTIDLTTGAYTINASNASGGCIIVAININEHPGQIAFVVAGSASANR